ncbi:hypothetical protein DICPUDRAFT_157120 [Dictyostelium purpureum]|uniref:Thioredoxin domain-containing protein n=1 Tax=Dictyostelium purpureum TaxID=5786 RepID=F0ZYA9_DICPU|nr:uncharacterized protein DICPUDRAFT_157120 [Dictyostelium purpureum]EGC31080.1 hypothetical protein DICPUDRAFT_157120 [Dictyostelium purpureum]|eukprot:XP_003292406.1 hypothetical protein DICPUDRAFT_157120 [Dictyostelium purpureum]
MMNFNRLILKNNNNIKLIIKNSFLTNRVTFTSSIRNYGRYNSSTTTTNETLSPRQQEIKSRMSKEEYEYHQERMRYEEGKSDLVFNKDLKAEKKEQELKEQEKYSTEPLIYDVSMKNFNDVTMNSKPPVILNCYSNKGDLSKLSNEALEAYAKEYAGCFVLAKLDVDSNIEIAAELKITKLPTMFVIHNREVLQQFVGLPNHEALDELIQRLITLSGGLVNGKTIDQNQAIAENYIRSNQDDKALEIYNMLLEKDTTQSFRTLLGLVQCYTNLNNEEMVNQTLSTIKEKFPNELDHRKISICKRILDLKKEVSKAVEQYKNISVSEFENKIKENPNDNDSKYDVSLLYYQQGQYEKAINQLLEIIKFNKKYTRSNVPDSNDSAKNLLIKIFESLDNQDPLVIKSRNKLNNIWFS